MRVRHVSIGAAVLALSLGAGPALAKPPVPGLPVSQSCAASQLSLAVPAAIAGDPTAGMGKLAWNILLRNTGHAGCSLRGWAGLDVTATGKPVAITSQDVSFSNLAAVSPQRVVLAAGQRAVVTVQASDATAGCRSPWQLTLRLPGAAGSITASQPSRFFGPCGGGLLRLSPFYPLSALARAVAGLTVAHSPSPFHTTKAPVPGACTPRRLRVAASYDKTGSDGSVTILRLVSRSSALCVLPGEWPAITLHAADGTTQIAKALPGLPRGVTRSPLTVYQQAHPVRTDVTLSRGTATSIALVTRTTGPGACHVAATATVYPGLTSTGAGLTVRLARPVTFCGLPRVLSFLAGHPPTASLLAEARALNGGLSPYGPAGFWYGSDSNAPVPCCHNGRGVWLMPNSPKGGPYGGYVGEVGAYNVWQGCTSGLNWNQTGYNDAEANLTGHSVGVGAGGYWMMAGPGREPGGYTTSGTSATSWGTAQAQSAVSDASQTLGLPYLFMDIEAAVPHGWNAGWAGVCSSTKTASSIPAALDWDTFNGFWNYVNGTTALFPAVYEAGDGGPNSWNSIFGSGLTLSNTLEWTYVNETSSISTFPYGWSINGTVPVWFASAPSNCQMMWQWSGGNGQLNGVGDFDQIDGSRNRLCK